VIAFSVSCLYFVSSEYPEMQSLRLCFLIQGQLGTCCDGALIEAGERDACLGSNSAKNTTSAGIVCPVPVLPTATVMGPFWLALAATENKPNQIARHSLHMDALTTR
jgi:hypothetical protein